MGGLVKIVLKKTTELKINKFNKELKEIGFDGFFNSLEQERLEYEYYLNNKNQYPDHLFDKDQINNFDDFLIAWRKSPFYEKHGEGSFDCYFERTPLDQMKNFFKWLVKNKHFIKKVSGSFSYFLDKIDVSETENYLIDETWYLKYFLAKAV